MESKLNNSIYKIIEPHEPYSKKDYLVKAIREDNFERVLVILQYHDGNKKCGSRLITHVLMASALLCSVKVFCAVCPMLNEEINEFTCNVNGALECTNPYFETLTLYVLKSNNAKVYRAYFQMLTTCDNGLELFRSAVKNVKNIELAMFFSYAHFLMTGDNAALNVIQEYFPDNSPSKDLLDGTRIGSVDYIKWIIDTGKYTAFEIKTSGLLFLSLLCLHYLDGRLTYAKAKQLEKEAIQDRINVTLSLLRLEEL